MARRARWPYVLTAILSLLPLLAMAYVGTFSRYLADDYCTAGVLRSQGLWGGLRSWYTGWSGRFSYVYLMHLLHMMGPGATPYTTSVLLASWLVSLVALVRALEVRLGRFPSWAASTALAGSILLATALGAPDRYQSFYWQTGVVTYSAPLVLLNALAVMVVPRWGRPTSIPESFLTAALGFAMAFAIGGFSEVIGSVLVSCLALALLLAWRSLRRDSRRGTIVLLGAGLAGAVTAVVVMLLSPGSQVRLELMPDRMGLASLTANTVRFGAVFAVKSLVSFPGVALLVLLISLALGAASSPSESAHSEVEEPRPWPPALAAGAPLLIAFLLICASIFPAVYATSAYPAERTLVVAQYILACGLSASGYFLGRALRRRGIGRRRLRSRNIAGLLNPALVIVALTVSWQGLKGVLAFAPEARSFADQWERRHTQMSAASGREGTLAVPSLPHMSGLAEVGPEPDEWINACVAAAYGFEAVVAK